MAMAQDHLEAFSICYQKAVHRLTKVRCRQFSIGIFEEPVAQIVIDHEYASEYVYYKVPIPWMQVKLLRLLQYYPASGARTCWLS
jgi:AP-2 complex subunit alpha